MRTRRRNIQLELALEPEAKGEARSSGLCMRLATAPPQPHDYKRKSGELSFFQKL